MGGNDSEIATIGLSDQHLLLPAYNIFAQILAHLYVHRPPHHTFRYKIQAFVQFLPPSRRGKLEGRSCRFSLYNGSES